MTKSPNPQPAIEVRELRKVYAGGVEAVTGISFEVQPGEVFGLLGPNGAGKSTTIGMLTTTVTPTSGAASVAGFDVVRQPLQARAASAVVFQDAVVDRSLTGRKNLGIHARLWGVPRTEIPARLDSVIERFGLGEFVGRAVDSYSGGQRRRLEIARALVSRPAVLFLDEPTVGLDPRIRHELLDVIATVGAVDEMTVMLTTHYLDEAEKLCDRVAIVHAGKIVALGSPGDLLSQLGEQIVELRVDTDASGLAAYLRDRRIVTDGAFAVGNTLTAPLSAQNTAALLDAVNDFGLTVIASTSRKPTLDDVYLQLTGDRIAAA